MAANVNRFTVQLVLSALTGRVENGEKGGTIEERGGAGRGYTTH